VLGLGLILGIGGAFIVLNFTLHQLVKRIRPDTDLNRYRNASWNANELLEMQSIAFPAIRQRLSSFCDFPVEGKKTMQTREQDLGVVTCQSSRSDVTP
jgi:hypothetical protein